MRPRTRSIALGLGLALAMAHACGGDDGGGTVGNGGSGANIAGGSGGGGGSGADASLNLDGNNPDIESLAVEPASATISVLNGTSSPVAFKAVAKYKNGSTATVAATWSFDRLDLAAISPAGSLQAHGNKGGKGTVSAKLGALTGTASATVQLTLEDDTAGLSPADKAKFDTPDSASSGTLLYPYDQTVFARGVLAPEIMWEGGAAGDKYRVTIVDAYVTLTAFFQADPPSRWLMPKAFWTTLTESSEGGGVSVKVQRMDAAGAAHQAMAQTWRIAPGSLRGTIYYWAVSKGQIMKINPGADSAVAAFDPGPYDQVGSPAPISGYGGQTPPWDNNGSGKRCVACHTVSRDGSTLAALFSACPSGTSCNRPWGIVNTASSAIQLISTYAPAPMIYSALTPNGSHLVHDTATFGMKLADAKTGAPVGSALDGFSKVASPQFSPDGKLLAFASNVTGAYPVEYSLSDLDVVDVDLTTAPYFTNRRTIQNATAANEEVAFPSFSPDSKWIVYQRGDYSRASYGSPPLKTGLNNLFMADVDKQVGQIKLARASGEGVLGQKDLNRNYCPRVNPVAVAGYFWVVFVSPRDYGNRMRSTSDSTQENRKQLWVAAIDANPSAGQDPSHPAFWLPGQDLATVNMDAYWALEPCKQNGVECNEGYECCEGFCRDQGDGTFKCIPPPVNQCALVGEACKTTADCCQPPGSKIECIGGFCALPGPS